MTRPLIQNLAQILKLGQAGANIGQQFDIELPTAPVYRRGELLKRYGAFGVVWTIGLFIVIGCKGPIVAGIKDVPETPVQTLSDC